MSTVITKETSALVLQTMQYHEIVSKLSQVVRTNSAIISGKFERGENKHKFEWELERSNLYFRGGKMKV